MGEHGVSSLKSPIQALPSTPTCFFVQLEVGLRFSEPAIMFPYGPMTICSWVPPWEE